MNSTHRPQNMRSENALLLSKKLMLLLLLVVLVVSFWVLLVPAHGAIQATGQGCAPDVPPPVAGNAVPATATPGLVLLNEVLADPHSRWNCSEPANVYSQADDSWIELYNPQSQALDLYEAHAQLSLDGGSSSIYLPMGSVIAPGGFLVLFPQEKQNVDTPQPWNIVLSINGIIIDQAIMPDLQPDQSYARVPDGSTAWLTTGKPSIDASNNQADQPITPTPTKTPKPSPTPKPTATPKRTTAGASSGPASTGTQPPWSQIQFPAETSVPTPADTAIPWQAASPAHPNQELAQSQNNAMAPWLTGLSVILALGLLAALLWYWRLSRSP